MNAAGSTVGILVRPLLSTLVMISPSDLKERAGDWLVRNWFRIKLIAVLTIFGYYGAGLPGAAAEFIFFGGIVLGSTARSAYFKWKQKKEDIQRRTAKVGGEEFLLSTGWTTIVRLQLVDEMNIPIEKGGKMFGEYRWGTMLVKYDLEANDAVDKAWNEYGDYGYVVTDYKEAEDGVFTSDEWTDKKKYGLLD